VSERGAGCERVIVVGSAKCANSSRLREVAERVGAEAFLLDRADEIDAAWLLGKEAVGVTAGASAPEVLVREVVERLQELGAASVREVDGRPENVTFSMPKELRLHPVD